MERFKAEYVVTVNGSHPAFMKNGGIATGYVLADNAEEAIEKGRDSTFEAVRLRTKITINDDVKIKLLSITPYDLPRVDNA